MLLRKYMSQLGIGAAKIDFVLEKVKFKPGELVKGYFSIKGGTIEQKIRRLECDLIKTADSGEEEVIYTSTIHTTKEIQSDECEELSFTCTLPDNLSPSTKDYIYRFKTRMIFDQGVASVDHDEIIISQ